MPGPKPESYLVGLKRTCAAAASACPDIQIDEAVLSELAASLPADDVRMAATGIRLPIRFPDLQSEVNLIALLHLLDFGSGYNDLLLASAKRDAHETIQFGVLGLSLSGKRLDAVFLKCFSNFTVANYFAFSSHEDTPSPIPGVQISRPGPLAGLAEKLKEVLNRTGSILEEGGQQDLGALILEILDDQKAAGQPCSASNLVSELVESLPAFSDCGQVAGQKVLFQRKAQMLAADLYLRFAMDEPSRFAFSDYNDICADSGSMLPAVLRHLGVVRISGDTAKRQGAGVEERVLRAAAVTAADKLVEVRGGVFNAHQLGQYLIAKHGSDPECLKLRLQTQDTIAY